MMLPSHLPDLPFLTDSPEWWANLAATTVFVLPSHVYLVCTVFLIMASNKSLFYICIGRDDSFSISPCVLMTVDGY